MIKNAIIDGNRFEQRLDQRNGNRFWPRSLGISRIHQ